MPASQTLWSGVFAALHPQQIYQHNVHTLDEWVCAVLALSPTDAATCTDHQDVQCWYEQLRERLCQQPQEMVHAYAAVAEQLNGLCTDAAAAAPVVASVLALQQQLTQPVQQLQQLQEVVPDLALQLQYCARQTWSRRRQIEHEIRDLQEDMQRLQHDVRCFAASMTALALMSGLALALGSMTAWVLWPVGALVWIILIPTLIVMTVLGWSDWVKWQDDRQWFAHKQQHIDQLNQQLHQQQTLMACYHRWLAQTPLMQQRVGQILAAWQTLSSDVGMTLAQLESLRVEQARGHSHAAKQHLDDAQVEWQAAYEQIQALSVQPIVNPAPATLCHADPVLLQDAAVANPSNRA